MGQDHYFSAEPASPGELRRRTVTLAGRELRVDTAGGVFSPDGLDKGTAVLLGSVPTPPAAGTFLDLGCGWGPLALTLALSSPRAQVYAVDVNTRALDLTARNAATHGCENLHPATPEQVPPELTFDLIWSNPPIRVGKEALHGILRSWLPRLAPGGQAWLVVQKNLGADRLQSWIARELADGIPSEGPGSGGLQVERATTSKGFRVLRVSRPG